MRSRFPQGIPMQDGTTSQTFPYPEGSPDKPEWLARDPVACGEWDRICGALDARRGLSPAWRGIISVAAGGYSMLAGLTKAREQQGPISGAEDTLSAVLANYRSACQECQVEPNPLMSLRAVAFID